jgi:diadenosine tetraphosphate (Ap4A) HIT family hydrolase
MPAPSWQDSERWKQLVAGDGCPLCDRHERRGMVAQLNSCYAVVDPTVGIRGYCCLILNKHATEIHHLTTDDARSFIADVQRAARAVQQVTGAIKINYEIHGNVIPHVHMHLIPRYAGDAIECSGLPWNMQPSRVAPDADFDGIADRLRAVLAGTES